MATILLTNVRQYTGPGALDALLGAGHLVLCQDLSFSDSAARTAFEREHERARALNSQLPDELQAEVIQEWGCPDGVVLNEVYPLTKGEIEFVEIEDLRRTFATVVERPFRLAQLFLPLMKARRRGTFVFVTSARELSPEPGFAVPTMLRAATTAFAKALAKEGASFGIQSNVVAPNYLYSEMYYPRAVYVDSQEGREAIAKIVPAGRLGEQHEVGALINFLASGTSLFTTGQVVYFTGGWP